MCGSMANIINQKYPHLLPVDVPVWERFLSLFGDMYKSIDYDIRVGHGRDRFKRELQRLRAFRFKLLVVEATAAELESGQ